MKTFRKRQIWKACKMSPTGKTNWLRKRYYEATAPSWLSLSHTLTKLIWDAVCKPYEME